MLPESSSFAPKDQYWTAFFLVGERPDALVCIALCRRAEDLAQGWKIILHDGFTIHPPKEGRDRIVEQEKKLHTQNTGLGVLCYLGS